LRERLEREAPEVVAELYRRASAWYAQHHLFDQAIEHAQAAGDKTSATALTEQGATSTIEREVVASMLHPQAAVLVEPLSERELEVLRLIAEGASNQAIASALVISIGTVKSHINHILGKLAAQNRTEAVAHGRSCGLLRRYSGQQLGKTALCKAIRKRDDQR
jgi:ATP/maltotriose-dependent transcriptional regulator MalT